MSYLHNPISEKGLEPMLRFTTLAAITLALIHLTVKLPDYLPSLAEGKYIFLIMAGMTCIATIKSYAQALHSRRHVFKMQSFIIHCLALLFGGSTLLYRAILMRSFTSPEDSVTAQGILQVSLIIAAMTLLAIMKELIGAQDRYLFR